ncbi:CLUMA_CG002443, isoform A [Clunio marinus]|uniref:CLUMA_CG002443, isoform A n=1 Tax=Clunio marinus TaxID=568069 RepID=A0A1J1HL82_9DIPT|nr:CLUMA_CG002443, isoform A [Clunio marinus]
MKILQGKLFLDSVVFLSEKRLVYFKGRTRRKFTILALPQVSCYNPLRCSVDELKIYLGTIFEVKIESLQREIQNCAFITKRNVNLLFQADSIKEKISNSFKLPTKASITLNS